MIQLPPPPAPKLLDTRHVPSSLGPALIEIYGYTVDQLRARDLEVARVVLEAAIAQVKSRLDSETKAMAHHAGTWYAASQYHADRVTAASQMLDVLRALEIAP